MIQFYDRNLGEPSALFHVQEQNENSSFPICLQLILPGSRPTERLVQAILTTPENFSGVEDGVEFKQSGNVAPLLDRELSFSTGAVNGSVVCTDVEIVGDEVYEPTTFFVISVVAVSGADAIAGESNARIVISDDDNTSEYLAVAGVA